ncbi:MAG: hypothetical protein ABI386_05390 [Rhodanobacter sp.]
MHARNDNPKPLGGRRGRLWFGLAMALSGVLALCGAWREITHHDGATLVVVPAAVMPVLAAWWARRAKRWEKR